MSALPHSAMVLAAGLGLRMRPLTETLPKPLVPVLGKPLIDYTLDLLDNAGIRHVVVNASWLAPKLEAHLSAHYPKAVLSHEETPLETGGGIARALPLLGNEPFFCLNSDTILIDPHAASLRAMAGEWKKAEKDALLLLMPRERAIGFDGPGDFFLEASGCLRRRGDAESAPYVFTGVQLLHPRLFAAHPGGAFSMNILYNREMSESGLLDARIGALVHSGDWLHVGDIKGLAQAERYLSDRSVMP